MLLSISCILAGVGGSADGCGKRDSCGIYRSFLRGYFGGIKGGTRITKEGGKK